MTSGGATMATAGTAEATVAIDSVLTDRVAAASTGFAGRCAIGLERISSGSRDPRRTYIRSRNGPLGPFPTLSKQSSIP